MHAHTHIHTHTQTVVHTLVKYHPVTCGPYLHAHGFSYSFILNETNMVDEKHHYRAVLVL